MSSNALDDWSGARAAGLDRLLLAHRAVAGAGPGRRWITVELNHALIVRLASEFQGFCRELHDETAEALLAAKVPTDREFASVVAFLLGTGRRLDRGNASWGNVCDDFARFGLSLADLLRARQPSRYPAWTRTMDRLNAARNAIAHDDRAGLVQCAAVEALTLETFRRWRRNLDAIARAMDAVIGAYLTETLEHEESLP
ncbi:MAG: hypothetical protein ACT4QG_05670 [Sporichthyaceae bacterium]